MKNQASEIDKSLGRCTRILRQLTILFCLIAALICMFGVKVVTKVENQVAYVSITFSLVIFAAVQLFGAYSAYRSDSNCLYWIASFETHFFSQEQQDIMKSFALDYVFSNQEASPFYTHRKMAEGKMKVWDELQASGCCGLNGPADWKEWRPDIKDDNYPKSCCHPEILTHGKCHLAQAYHVGCNNLTNFTRNVLLLDLISNMIMHSISAGSALTLARSLRSISVPSLV